MYTCIKALSLEFYYSKSEVSWHFEIYNSDREMLHIWKREIKPK